MILTQHCNFFWRTEQRIKKEVCSIIKEDEMIRIDESKIAIAGELTTLLAECTTLLGRI